LDNGLGLHIQVYNHGVLVPTADDLNEIHIDFATEESHGADGTQITCTDFCCCNAHMMEVHGHRMPDIVGYLLGLNHSESAMYMDGRYRHSASILAQVFMTGCCLYWAAHHSAIHAMYDFLIPYTAFMRGEGVQDGHGTVDVGAQHCAQLSNADVQVYILQPEWRVIAHRASVPPPPTAAGRKM
jgi:hypothetical protein